MLGSVTKIQRFEFTCSLWKWLKKMIILMFCVAQNNVGLDVELLDQESSLYVKLIVSSHQCDNREHDIKVKSSYAHNACRQRWED